MTLDEVLQLHDIIVVDTEFRQDSDAGKLPHPWCISWMSLRDRVPHKVWLEGSDLECPYDPETTIVVAYYAPAEMSVFLQLGWSLPKMVVDLFAEYALKTNGWFGRRSLLDAMRFHGLRAMDVEHKTQWRERLITSDPPFPEETAHHF